MLRYGALAREVELLPVFLLFSLPFSIPWHSAPFTAFYNEWSAILLLFTTLCILPFIDKKVPALSYWFLVFTFFTLVQPILIGSEYTYSTWFTVLYLISGALAIWLGHNLKLFYQETVYILIAYSIVLGGIVNASFVFYQWYTQTPVIGALAQANNTADYIFLAFISVIYLSSQFRLSELAHTFLIFLFGSSLIFVQSRSVLIYLIIFAFASFIFFKDNKQFRREILVTCSVILILSIFVNTRVSETITAVTSTTLTTSDNLRVLMLQQAWYDFKDHWFFGIGVGNYLWAKESLYSIHSHNIFAQIMVETGIIGLFLIYVAFYCFCAFCTLKETTEYWYSCCVLSILLIHSLLEFPLWYANFLILNCVFLGFLTDIDLKPMKHFSLSNEISNTGAFRNTMIVATICILCFVPIYWYLSGYFSYRTIAVDSGTVEYVPGLERK